MATPQPKRQNTVQLIDFLAHLSYTSNRNQQPRQMETIQELRAEKRRLTTAIKQLRADIAAGLRPSRAQILNAIILEAFTQTIIP